MITQEKKISPEPWLVWSHGERADRRDSKLHMLEPISKFELPALSSSRNSIFSNVNRVVQILARKRQRKYRALGCAVAGQEDTSEEE